MRRENDEDDASDAAERQRRIQEEIRRKIMERRRANSGGLTQAAPSGQQLSEQRREAQARREAEEREEQVRQAAREKVEKPSAYSVQSNEERSDSKPKFSWETSDDAYDTVMQQQLKRIEETKRQAERLKKQADNRKPSAVSNERQKKGRKAGGYFTGTVRESLKDPAAARVAFIYGEVLGQPVSLRKSQSVSGLN